MPQFRAATPFLIVALLGLAGCGNDVSRAFGFQRDAPDEFTVTTRAPLSMPPNYMLQPPRPGAARPQEMSSRNAAEAVLSPQAALGSAPVGTTPGERALSQAAGPAAPADIRNQLDSLAALDDPPPGFTDKLMVWMNDKQPGVLIDPEKEAQRLRENAALGQSNQDNPSSIIKPKRTSIFSNWF